MTERDPQSVTERDPQSVTERDPQSMDRPRIPRELIDADADKVVRRLSRHGFKAYLVGGCVRDLLLDRTPKDFDVATSATPTETKQLFRNCRIIGRRFRLAHIFFGGKIIETSTFRANPRQGEDAGEDDELLIRRDNVFGTDTEDARRRDFTINGLFYDVEAERVIDHVGGLDDLAQRLVRTIGDPDIRFREDPVRMLRAIKFAARLDFTIEEETFAALLRHRGEITKCAPPRVLEELYRLLRGGAARRSMELLVRTGFATTLSPRLAAMFGGVAPPPATAWPGAVNARPETGGAEEETGSGPAATEPEIGGATAETAAAAPATAGATAETADATAETAAAAPETAGAAPGEGGDGVDTERRAEERQWAAAWADERRERERRERTAAPAPRPGKAAPAARPGEAAPEAAWQRPRRAQTAPEPVAPALPPVTEPLRLGFVPDAAEIAERHRQAWQVLDQLDRLFAEGREMSNALLLAALCDPFVATELLKSGVRPIEANETIEELFRPLVDELRIARRDAERTRQILLTQRRLAPARRRRGKPAALVHRDYFREALTVYELSARAAGRDTSDIVYWRKLLGEAGRRSEDDGASPRKQRRRRRGGRRRRRTESDGEEIGESSGPAAF